MSEKKYYLSGTTTGLSAKQAKERAAANMPAVARPQDRADWYVAYLSEKIIQDDVPFILTPEERATLS